MLGALVTAVPLMVTLAAAIYFIRKSFQQYPLSGEGFGETAAGWHEGPNSGYTSGFAAGRARSTCRWRRPLIDQSERKRCGKEELQNECAVCLDNESNIELSPCGHMNVCIDCVNRIITNLDRRCPLCRTYIQAYDVISS